MIESNYLFKDSTFNIRPSSPKSSLVVSSTRELDQELTYQQLTCLFLKQKKNSQEQKQELMKTQIEFEKFNKRVEKRIQEEEREFKKEKQILIEKNKHLERTLKTVCQKLAKVLGANNSCGELDTQKIESENPEKVLGIMAHLDHLEKAWKENSIKLKQQLSHILELELQTNLLKQETKINANQLQKLKLRLKMTENIVRMAEEDKRKINDEWLHQIQQEKLEQVSMRDFKNIIGAMKIQQRHLKRRNQQLVEEIQILMNNFNEKLESLVTKINKLEYEKNKEELTRNRTRQFST